ncbi:MAG TPA: glycogen debranching N-terminal domain-containing protein, partial [Candidatus Binataceae bacterium]|nr:glycogen debranching N-terminal domain-containing protein [Candidatus Binataceae bacterium]
DLIQIQRSWALSEARLFQKVELRNYAPATIKIELNFTFGADFRDMFEVRGLSRRKRGMMHEARVDRRSVEFRYSGLDGIERSTLISFSHKPAALDASNASFMLELKHDISTEIEIAIEARQEHTSSNGKSTAPRNFGEALARRQKEVADIASGFTRISTSNQIANSLIARSLGDLAALTTANERGHTIMAGIPWFATLFGRDSIITALSVLPFFPEPAAGVLRTLASLQGTESNEARDEEPGKIIHEMRACEMANTGEIPFGRYYGSVDSTPLFLWLLGRYVAATGDLSLAEELWPNVERALDWIGNHGDRDGDGYIEYQRETPQGLANQGWKDSLDAISHADGALAKPPIALAEVQGYVYAAYCVLSEIAGRLGKAELHDHLREEARTLKTNFERDFFLAEQNLLALALDGEKRPCAVMASNGAHCLATGLLEGERAASFADRLLAEDMFSGWGVRTLGSRERRYNPMSYHNGSVWPHDNAIAAWGLASIGRTDGAAKIMTALFEAAAGLRNESLPELFCGFAREPSLGPVPYPVACHPQAWSAASVFLLFQAILGMEVRGFERRIVMRAPVIPQWLDWIKFEDLRLGKSSISFIARRGPRGASIEVLEKRGPATVEVHK